MVSEEIILERDRVECLVDTLKAMLEDTKAYYQFKFRFDESKITIIPHAQPVEIKL